MNAITSVVGIVKKLAELTDVEREQLKALHKELIDYEYNFTPQAMRYVFNALDSLDDSLEEIIQVIDFVYFLVRTDTMDMIGFLAVNQGEPYEIAALYVKEEHRGKAMGSVMVARFAQMHMTEPTTVNCFEKNERALSFYKSMGFTFSPHCRGHSVWYGVRRSDLDDIAANNRVKDADAFQQLTRQMPEEEHSKLH